MTHLIVGFAVAQRSYSLYLHPLHRLKFKISQPPGTFIAQRAYRAATLSWSSPEKSVELLRRSSLTQPDRNAAEYDYTSSLDLVICEGLRQCDQATHPDYRNRVYTTMQDHNKEEPSPAEEEQARSHPNIETNNKTKFIDPNIDYDKYPNYEVLEIKVEKVDDTETPRGDMSDIYRPEGDFGLARPWLRPVYDIDAEEPDYSEEIAAWERQKEETGESIYIPPEKTIDDLKWGPLDEDASRNDIVCLSVCGFLAGGVLGEVGSFDLVDRYLLVDQVSKTAPVVSREVAGATVAPGTIPHFDNHYPINVC